MEFSARSRALAKITRAASPVVSVYLNTRWADEQQRERVRVFLKNAIREARKTGGAPGLAADLRPLAALREETPAARSIVSTSSRGSAGPAGSARSAGRCSVAPEPPAACAGRRPGPPSSARRSWIA